MDFGVMSFKFIQTTGQSKLIKGSDEQKPVETLDRRDNHLIPFYPVFKHNKLLSMTIIPQPLVWSSHGRARLLMSLYFVTVS